jgi:16S rRNA (guanine527-N7)-methyltransferase
VALVESVAKKCAFLEATARAAGLLNAGVACTRAEEWGEGAGRHDLVTARAVASLNTVLEYAAPLLAPGGRLVAWKGRRDGGEEADGRAAASELGLREVEVRRVTPFATAGDRHLHLYLKVGSTPNRYPRRAGTARKRPIRAST